MKSKLFFTCLLLVFTFNKLIAQNDVAFTDVDKVIRDIDKKGQESAFLQDLNFEAFLYLNKNTFPILQKTFPLFRITQNMDTSIIFSDPPKDHIRAVPCNFKNIKDFFTKKPEFLKLQNYLATIEKHANAFIDKQVFVRDNSVIVTLIEHDTFYSTRYKLTLTGNQLLLYKLYDSIIIK